MSTLSTHVLDTTHGRPAAGVSLTLCGEAGGEGAGEGGAVLFAGATDEDGRCPGMPALPSGRYKLTFAVADYFLKTGIALPEPPFLDLVTIDFGVSGEGHYHVPLLVSPFGYSTYRGS
jgi:5-hydroxyisourate hydrolase